uniref:Uncharacterized protein n=1 Tax=Acanthochromis polyacanthus TaxID=80966 RepID=A0A3Q1FH31_9TELE
DWTDYITKIPPQILERIRTDQKSLTMDPTNNEPNLTEEEYQALQELRNDTSLVIKPADKGSALVIMDRTDYVHEALHQLQDHQYYMQLQEPIYPEMTNLINKILTTLVQKKIITKKQANHIKGTDTPRPCYFYLLPKIHKPPQTWTVPYQIPAGRPIVSDCGSESYGIHPPKKPLQKND